MSKLDLKVIEELVQGLEQLPAPKGYILLPRGDGEVKVYTVDARTLETILKLDLKSVEKLLNPYSLPPLDFKATFKKSNTDEK